MPIDKTLIINALSIGIVFEIYITSKRLTQTNYKSFSVGTESSYFSKWLFFIYRPSYFNFTLMMLNE